jgi:hypothetical protein
MAIFWHLAPGKEHFGHGWWVWWVLFDPSLGETAFDCKIVFYLKLHFTGLILKTQI